MSEETEKEELDVYEARQLNRRYSDDTWNLIGYTSELRNKKDNSFFAFVDFNADDVGRIRECPNCLEYELHNKLGAKIKKKGEPPAPDDENWLSCYECGNIFPIHETFTESKIKDSVETTDNPFENESIFLSTDSRKEQRRKGKKRKSRFHTEEHEDPEIQAELHKGNIVKILYGSSKQNG